MVPPLLEVPPVFEVKDRSCRRGGRLVFDRLSFGLGGGELLALTGRNGSGKTSLLRALAGLTPPEAGKVAWRGVDVAEDPEAWRGRLAWLGHLEGLKGDLTVVENLLIAERLRGGEAGDRLDGALVAFDLTGLAAREVRTLSAGQRRRTALARILLSQAPLWLLDEPLNALDAPAQAAFRTALQVHLAAGGLAIAATHAELGIEGRSLELGPNLSSPSPPGGGREHEGDVA